MKIWLNLVIFIIAISIAAYSINELLTSDERLLENPKVQSSLAEVNQASLNVLDICMEAKTLDVLIPCKEEGMPTIIESCKDKLASTMTVCSDTRLSDFFVTIDNRINSAEKRLESLEKEIETLTQKETMQEQIPVDSYLQSEMARTIRDCIRYANEWYDIETDLVNAEIGATWESKDSIQTYREKMGICSADIKEIEAGYCSWYDPSCTTTGRFEDYWDIVGKIPKPLLDTEKIVILKNFQCNKLDDKYSKASVVVQNNYVMDLSPKLQFTNGKPDNLGTAFLLYDVKVVSVGLLKPNEEKLITDILIGSGDDFKCSIELKAFR